MLPPAQLRGTFGRGDKRSRLDCVVIRQISRSGRWPFCAADIQKGRRNFRPCRDPSAAAIGAPSPGMVIDEKPVRFTPIRECRRRLFQKNPTPPTPNPTEGRIRGTNPAPRKRLSSRLGIQFFSDLRFFRGPSFPLDTWKFNHAWVGGGGGPHP